MLIGIGEAHHSAGAAGTDYLEPRRRQPLLDGGGGGQSQLLAVIDDQADAGQEDWCRSHHFKDGLWPAPLADGMQRSDPRGTGDGVHMGSRAFAVGFGVQ